MLKILPHKQPLHNIILPHKQLPHNNNKIKCKVNITFMQNDDLKEL